MIGSGWEGVLFASTALMQLFTAVTLFFLKWDPVEQRAKQKGSGERSSFFDGFKYLWNEKVLLGLVSIGVAFAMIGGAAGFMLPIFADAMLGEGATGLGYLMTVSTLGGAAGAVAVVSLSNVGHRGYILLFVAILNTGLLIAFSKSEIFALTMVLVFGMGLAQVMFRAMRIVAMQILTPDDLRGRVMSFQTTIQGMTWIGVMVLGGIAEILKRPEGLDLGIIKLGGDIASGVADTILISGIAYGLVSILCFLIFPSLRKFQ